MKKLFLAAAVIAAGLATNAQVKMPAPSPTQTIKQDFALGSIELTYSRPSAKGRKVFGDLVPYDSVWRTGANAATLIKFNDVVELKGKRIDTGTYALYTIPGQDEWEIILNKGVKNWGAFGYKQSDDVVRVKVPVTKMKTALENFTMQFSDIKPESCELHMMWAKTDVAIPFTAVIKERMKAQVEKAMASDKKPYFAAAQFYYEYDKNNAKALEAAKGAVAENPKAYWAWIYKAKIEKEMGDKAAAKASSEKSLELAMADGNSDYVKINRDFLKKL